MNRVVFASNPPTNTGIPRGAAAVIGHGVPDGVPNERLAGLGPESRKPSNHTGFSNGETRTRTGDTTIFSRVLYQLSYLAPAQG